MRLIDADALKDWLEIVPLTWDGGVDINDLVEHIDLMPTESEWILCSENLPKEDSRVLTTIQLPHCKRYVISSDYLRHTFYNDNGDCWMDDDEEVLAWMPLTNPWEGKK